MITLINQLNTSLYQVCNNYKCHRTNHNILGLPKIPDNPVVVDRRFTFDIPVENYKSKTEEEQRIFNFQASDKNEYQQWRVKLGSNVSGNARVFKTGTPGQLGHITLNLDVTDHIIGKVYFTKHYGLLTVFLSRACPNCNHTRRK